MQSNFRLPDFGVVLEQNKIIHEDGGDGTIYLSGDSVVKVYGNWNIWNNLDSRTSKLLRAQGGRESRIARELYGLGVSVPKPEGLFSVDVLDECTLHKGLTAYVMEYIDGINGEELFSYKNSMRARALDLMGKELAKAKAHGFVPDDIHNFSNHIYVPRQDKVFLIDFVQWRLRR